MNLVIAEKPSVAKTISAVLKAKELKGGFFIGNGYIISWCIGHLVSLTRAESYDEKYAKWRYTDLPIIPKDYKYTVSSDKEKQIKLLVELMKRYDVENVINACDSGREGELKVPFSYENELATKSARLILVNSELNMDAGNKVNVKENDNDKLNKPSVLQALKENKEIISSNQKDSYHKSHDISI